MCGKGGTSWVDVEENEQRQAECRGRSLHAKGVSEAACLTTGPQEAMPAVKDAWYVSACRD
jgi:hypothetical protein